MHLRRRMAAVQYLHTATAALHSAMNLFEKVLGSGDPAGPYPEAEGYDGLLDLLG